MRIFWPFMVALVFRSFPRKRESSFPRAEGWVPACAGTSGLRSLQNARHYAGADRFTALANGEAQLLLHGDRHDQRPLHRDVVAWHDHFGARRQRHYPGHVSGTEVKLRPVIGEERLMSPALPL